MKKRWLIISAMAFSLCLSANVFAQTAATAIQQGGADGGEKTNAGKEVSITVSATSGLSKNFVFMPSPTVSFNGSTISKRVCFTTTSISAKMDNGMAYAIDTAYAGYYQRGKVADYDAAPDLTTDPVENINTQCITPDAATWAYMGAKADNGTDPAEVTPATTGF